ncbi:hypothetical protein KPL74_10990 [Bacillus sp. NP157]|nr:hypothetical protein KPL74_10990 [Bacillus sp. NP157]
MKFQSSVLLAAALATALSGCASVGIGPRNPSNDATTTSVAHGAMVGGAVGCAAGFVSGLLTHSGLSIKRCAIGGAAGAVVGGVVGYKQGLEKANALAEQARNGGLVAQVQTKTVSATDSTGKTEHAQALDRLTIQLLATDIARRGPTTAGILAKAAALADESAEPVTLTVSGTPTQRAWLVQTLRADLKSDTTATLIEKSASATPSLELSPVPDVPHTSADKENQ